MKSFWNDLKKPFTCLAPMENVTDTVFRQIIASVGKPDVFFTEFTNVEGMFSEGSKHVLTRFQYTDVEKPLIAQIWGLQPELFYKAAHRIEELGFNGIDINMGCPVRDVTATGACSALMKNKSLASEIIQATKEGANRLPVSIKTRIGYHTIQTEEWISFLLSQSIECLIIHARTVKEVSSVPAHWDEIGKAVELRNKVNPHTVIVGNGDVMSLADAQNKAEQYGVDGVMIGRGVFHNPWVFNKEIDIATVSIKTRLELLLKHTRLFYAHWGESKDFNVLKKFFKIYASGFTGASDLRVQLMQTRNVEEVEKIISTFLTSHN